MGLEITIATNFNTRVHDPQQAARVAAATAGFAAGETGSIENLFIEQIYEAYTEDDHAAWRALYQRQEGHRQRRASRLWLHGADAVGLSARGIPRLADINAPLDLLTGWRSWTAPALELCARR